MSKRIVCYIWCWWHMYLRKFFDSISKESYWGTDKPRPWWHLCCNGLNSIDGGWRTRLCDRMETYWRS
jgi:hypothetical protein